MYQKPGGGLKSRAKELRVQAEQERVRLNARNRLAMFEVGRRGIRKEATK